MSATERPRWPSCNCPAGPFDDEVVYDRNCTPRCPRCNVALGGDPMTDSERAALEAEEATPAPSPSIPAGMVPYGPEHPDYPNAPQDWNGGKVVDRDGSPVHFFAVFWNHDRSGGEPGNDIIAYTPEPQPSPAREGEVDLAAELLRLHDAARGCEFDLVPADGPIARLALFMHEHGATIAAALAKSPAPDADAVREALERLTLAAESIENRYGYDDEEPKDWSEWVEIREAIDAARAALSALQEEEE